MLRFLTCDSNRIRGVLHVPRGLSKLSATHNSIRFVYNVPPTLYNIDLYENKLLFVMSDTIDRFSSQIPNGSIQSIAHLYSAVDMCYRDEELGGMMA
jgi:hypothetical protein